MVEEIRAYKTKNGEVCENVVDAAKKEEDENREKFIKEFLALSIFDQQWQYEPIYKPVLTGIGVLIYNNRKLIKPLIDKYL